MRSTCGPRDPFAQAAPAAENAAYAASAPAALLPLRDILLLLHHLLLICSQHMPKTQGHIRAFLYGNGNEYTFYHMKYVPAYTNYQVTCMLP